MRVSLRGAITIVAATLLIGSLGLVTGAKASTPTCFGKRATIVSNKATIAGTNHADVIVAGNGNNTINAKGGKDLICAHGGKDAVNGGAGDDKIDTGPGTDVANGAGGNDVIKGGDSNDGTLECLNQSFQPTSFLKGGGGNDKVYGGGGDDCLSGGPGSDKLFGQVGNDIMFADPGTDTLNGGANGNPLVDPTQLGDTASFVFLASAVTANLTTDHATSTAGGTDTLTAVENLFGTTLADTLKGNSASALPDGPVNGLEGGLGDDTINGNGGALEIGAFLLAPAAVTVTPSGPGTPGLNGTSSGGEGNDMLSNLTGVAGSNFNDTLTWAGVIFGGAGNDSITAFDGSQISAGDGNDTVNGSAGNDAISGDAGDDTINGNAGNDAMDGDTGGVNIGGTNDTGDGGIGTDGCVDFETVTNCE